MSAEVICLKQLPLPISSFEFNCYSQNFIEPQPPESSSNRIRKIESSQQFDKMAQSATQSQNERSFTTIKLFRNAMKMS